MSEQELEPTSSTCSSVSIDNTTTTPSSSADDTNNSSTPLSTPPNNTSIGNTTTTSSSTNNSFTPQLTTSIMINTSSDTDTSNNTIKLIPKLNQCNYLVKHKKRYCNRDKAPNSNYCHTHSILDTDDDTNTNTTNNNNSKKRVKCPIDPNHTVYEYRLSKHIKICNKSIEQSKMKSQPYFNKNLHYNYLYNQLNNNNTINSNNNNINSNNNNINNNIEYTSIGELYKNNPIYFNELLNKINKIYSNLNINELIKNSMNENYKFISSNDEEFNEKHFKQHSSFIYNLNIEQCLSNKYNYIEFGCGKGNLSYFIRRALIDHQLNNNNTINSNIDSNTINSNTNIDSNIDNNTKQTFILIDRENQRRKVDNFIKYGKKIQNNNNNNTTTNECNIERLLIDIGDLDCSKINTINNNQMNNNTNNNNHTISISKHLCGIATDLTLSCLKDLNDKIPNINNGIFIALCCHHKCTFNGYINKEFLLQNNINEFDFSIIKLLTSYATCQFSKLQNKNMDQNGGDVYGLNDLEKEEIGLKCKRILDYGRLQYIKQTNQYSTVKLIYYCNKETTLENCMLIALK